MEDQAAGFLLLIMMLFGLALLLHAATESTRKPKDCDVHDWSYNKDNKLQCTRCLMIAGTHKTDRGDY